MDQAVKDVIAAYESRIENEEKLIASLSVPEGFKRRDELLLSVGHDSAVFLNSLAKSAGARSILEIGTSYGYSTVWLGEAAKVNGGKLTTLELAPNKQAYAREMASKAKLNMYIDFQMGDARELIAALPGPFDFVLLDLWKELYIPCFDLIYPKLAEGAIVIADNMLDPPILIEDANVYRRHIRTRPDLDTVLLPLGSGIEVTRLRRKPI